MLNETSTELHDALKSRTGLKWEPYHTGGGCMVASALLDGDRTGKMVWVTRDGHPVDVWLVGIYEADGSDDGEGDYLYVTVATPDDPKVVADAIADALSGDLEIV